MASRRVRYAFNPTASNDQERVQIYDESISGYRKANEAEALAFYQNYNLAESPVVGDRLRANGIVKSEQGVTDPERFKIKWLAQNKDAARRSLEAMDYDVKEYGDGVLDKLGLKINFAVRKKGESGPYKLLDPEASFLDVGPWEATKEFARDIFDMAADYIQGGVMASFAASGAAAGTPLGPHGAAIGGALAGGAAGFATEGIRQGLGQAAGLDQTPDPSEAALVGLAGALGPAAAKMAGRNSDRMLRALGTIKSKVADGTLELSARLAGVQKSDSIILPEDALFNVAMKGKNKILRPFEAAKSVGADILNKMRRGDNIPERRIANEMMDEMARLNDGVFPVVDLSHLVTKLEENIPGVTGEVIERTTKKVRVFSEESAKNFVESQRTKQKFTPTPTGRMMGKKVPSGSIVDEDIIAKRGAKESTTVREATKDVRSLKDPEAVMRKAAAPDIGPFSSFAVDTIEEYLAVAGPDGSAVNIARVPLPIAENVRRMLGKMAAKKGAFRGMPPDKDIAKFAQGVERSAAASIRKVADDTGVTDSMGRPYGAVIEELGRRIDQRKKLIKFMGVPHLNPDKLRSEDWQKLESRVTQVFGKKRGAWREFAEQAEHDMGVSILKPFREATEGTMVGLYGDLPTAPRLTATGGILGAGLGAGVGGFLGNPIMGGGIGTAAGLVGGSILGSPGIQKNAIRVMTKGDRMFMSGVNKFSRYAGPPISAAASAGGRVAAPNVPELIIDEQAEREKLRVRR